MQVTVLDITTEPRQLDGVVRPALMICAILAVVGFGGALLLAKTTEGGMDYLLETYLVSFAFFLSISLGALFFVLLQHCTRAGWSVVVRRVAEATAANVWVMAVLAVPVILGMDHLYRWADAGAAAHEALLAAKAGATYVSPFIGRLDDVSTDGLGLISEIRLIFDNYGYETEILAASVRHTMHIIDCAKIGADVMTGPLSAISGLLKHPLTDIGLAKFLEDYKKGN